MSVKILFIEKLNKKYPDFVSFCQECGIQYVDELDKFIYSAYKNQYCCSETTMNDIKNIISYVNSQEIKSDSTETKLNSDTAKKQTIHDMPLSVRYHVSAEQYSNVPLEHVLSSTRTLNAFMRILEKKTLEGLLGLSMFEIEQIKNLGQKSIDRIISDLDSYFSETEVSEVFTETKLYSSSFRNTVKAMLYSQNEDITCLNQEEIEEYHKFSEIADETGKELCALALESPKHIFPIISALKDFSAIYRRNHWIEQEILHLPQNICKLKLNGFVNAYISLKTGNDVSFLKEFPENTLIRELPDLLIESKSHYNLKQFIVWLNSDFYELITEMFKKSYSRLSEREKSILTLRLSEKTLDEIANSFDVTSRERIRQLEVKACRKLADVKKLLLIIRALENSVSVLQFQTVSKYLDDMSANIIWFIGKKEYLNTKYYYFSNEVNAFIFQEDMEDMVNGIINLIPDIIEDDDLKKFVQEKCAVSNIPSEFVLEKIKKYYKRSGIFWYTCVLTREFKFGYILKKYFQNGYKIDDEHSYHQFSQLLKENFSGNIATQRSVDSIIQTVGVLIDRGRYVHPDNIKIDSQVIDVINNYFKESPRESIAYSEIFSEFQDELMNAGIHNRYMMQGVLKYYGCNYVMFRDVISKTGSSNINKEIENFVLEAGRVVTKEEIMNAFQGVREESLLSMLGRCTNILNIADNQYLHASYIDVSTEDYEFIRKYLEKNCTENAVSNRKVFEDFSCFMIDFLNRNEIYNHNMLYAVIKYLFSNEYNFSYGNISSKMNTTITKRDMILQCIGENDTIDYETLEFLCIENGIHYLSFAYLLDIIKEDYLCVDEGLIMKRSLIGLTDAVIDKVIELIKEKVIYEGGYLSSKRISDFGWFPDIQVSWTPYLIESIANISENKIDKVRIYSNSRTALTHIYIGQEYQGMNYFDFVYTILKNEHEINSFKSINQAADWLLKKGIINSAHPKLLDDKSHIYYDNGKLVII